MSVSYKGEDAHKHWNFVIDSVVLGQSFFWMNGDNIM